MGVVNIKLGVVIIKMGVVIMKMGSDVINWTLVYDLCQKKFMIGGRGHLLSGRG